MVVAETIAGLGAFKSMYDMAKALKDINDATVRNGAVIELQEKNPRCTRSANGAVGENRPA